MSIHMASMSSKKVSWRQLQNILCVADVKRGSSIEGRLVTFSKFAVRKYENYIVHKSQSCSVLQKVFSFSIIFSKRSENYLDAFWTPGLPEGVLCNHPCPSVPGPLVCH